MKNQKNILIIGIIIVIILIGMVVYGILKKETKTEQNPIATIEIENYGTIKVELYPKIAPNSVANFTKLANNGFYDGLTFHRIISDFMIQGGDFEGDGTGKGKYSYLDPSVIESDDYEYAITGEFINNGFENYLRHKKGVISMARSDYSSLGLVKEGYDSASTQFFIMTSDNRSLNGLYAAFGKVIEGYNIVEEIEKTEIKEVDEENNVAEGTPVNPPVIKTITVETFGVDYGMPDVKKAFDYNSYIQQMYGM